MQSVLVQFNKHPEERDLIGQMVLAYGVFEVALMEAVKAALNADAYTANRILFRLKSESNRLEVADAIIRPAFARQKLEGAWQDAYAAMKFCKRIRNTFAHSQWISDEHGTLRFGDLEQAAKTHLGESKINFHPLTKATLEKQSAYFDHTYHLLLWALDQYHLAAGQARKLPDNQHVPKPKRMPQPKLDSRGEAPTRRSNSKGGTRPR